MHPKVYGAAKSGDFDSLITIILGNGEDLFHQTTPKESNILHVATQYKQVNLIEHLLRHPSGPSLLWQGNSNGDTPLHIAAALGSCEAVRVFIDLAKSLHWVVENGHIEACKELLRQPNSNMDTALHYAVRGGHVGVVKLLIEEDPQLCDITNAADESPLYLSIDRGYVGIIEKSPLERRHLDIIGLILGASSLPSSHKGPKGLTALHAAINCSPIIWRKILEKRPEMIREEDDMGWTPLHYAACNGEVEAVRSILQHDTSVAYDLVKDGQSALHIAAFRGRIKVIDEIARSCPDAWDIINIKRQTALHAAIWGGQIDVVKYILRMPDLEYLINERDTNGNTALHLAALHKKYRIIYILARDKRVDRCATNKHHLTAVDIFMAHKEVGYRAAKVQYALKGSFGMSYYQDFLIDYMKGLDKLFIEGQSAVGITTGVHTDDSSKRSIIDIQLLVAVLIATVTFAAAFTMPGGFDNDGPNQGMPILAGRAAFQAFVVSNIIAFSFSIVALFIQFQTCFSGYCHQARYIPLAGCCIFIAIFGMVVAFVCGTYVALTKTIGLGIIPNVLFGWIGIMYIIGCFVDPHSQWDGDGPRSLGGYVRNLLFDCGMF